MADRQPKDAYIRSQSNAIVKLVRSLQRRKMRYAERAFVIDGVRGVEDAVRAGYMPSVLLVREDVADQIMPVLPGEADIRIVAERVFGSLSDVEQAQGVLGVFPMLWENHDVTAAAQGSTLVIDGVRDPGNCGTLLRSAAAAGMTQVILTQDTVDPYNPKTVRSGVGAHVRIPFQIMGRDEAREALRDVPLVAVADANAPTIFDEVDWSGPCAIVIGSEAEGVSAAIRAIATHQVTVPLANGVESLNAGVAGSLLMFEAARQWRRSEYRE